MTYFRRKIEDHEFDRRLQTIWKRLKRYTLGHGSNKKIEGERGDNIFQVLLKIGKGE